MYDNTIHSVVTIFTAIIGLAIIAVIVSKNANTSNVIGSGFGGLSRAIAAADAPITGGNGGASSFSALNSGYPEFQ